MQASVTRSTFVVFGLIGICIRRTTDRQRTIHVYFSLYCTSLLIDSVNTIIVQYDDAGERRLDEGGARQRTDVVTSQLDIAC